MYKNKLNILYVFLKYIKKKKIDLRISYSFYLAKRKNIIDWVFRQARNKYQHEIEQSDVNGVYNLGRLHRESSRRDDIAVAILTMLQGNCEGALLPHPISKRVGKGRQPFPKESDLSRETRWHNIDRRESRCEISRNSPTRGGSRAVSSRIYWSYDRVAVRV